MRDDEIMERALALLKLVEWVDSEPGSLECPACGVRDTPGRGTSKPPSHAIDCELTILINELEHRS